ncbi:HD family hydrolase [Enterobacter asburiae]|uniref:HD family hydrolase n=1 Tax=Enterobacter asburiae TaxID=61645 RepID=UPI001F152D1D|nr:HD family hydrolase [Enterobacter asburiae]
MSYIQTLSGKKFNFINPTAADVDIEDIANALSNICRFAGHLPEFYSVAQHSVLASQIVPPEFAFEARVDGLIRTVFGLPADMSPVVKYADLTMLATERRDLEIDDGTEWPCLKGIPTSDIIQIIPLRPGQAYGLFMTRFNELMELRACNNI